MQVKKENEQRESERIRRRNFYEQKELIEDQREGKRRKRRIERRIRDKLRILKIFNTKGSEKSRIFLNKALFSFLCLFDSERENESSLVYAFGFLGLALLRRSKIENKNRHHGFKVAEKRGAENNGKMSTGSFCAFFSLLFQQ